MKPFSIEGSVSENQCALLRHNVEEAALANVLPLPGVEFYQLQASFETVTYMILGGDAYCYERFDGSWRPMLVPVSHIRQAGKLLRRVA